MKKLMFILSVMTFAVMFTACKKQPVEVTKEKQITVDYVANGLTLAHAGPYYFDFSLNDIIEIDLWSKTGSNTVGWKALPFSYEGDYYYYQVSNNAIYFYCKVKDGYVFTTDFSIGAKIRYKTLEYN